MALLDGILGGAQSVQAYGQQQFQNKLARDKFELDENKFDEQKRQYDQSYALNVEQFNINNVYNKDANDRLNAQEARDAKDAGIADKKLANDTYYETLDMAGYLSQDRMSLNYNKINEDIAAGRNSDRFGAAEQIILGFATQFGNLPEGSKATSVEALDGGGYAITVTNADGSKGVVTEDGSSGPESSVVRFQPGQLGRLANTQFQREVATNTSKFDPTVMRTNLNLIDADSKQQALNDRERDFLAEKQYEKQVVDTAKQTGSVPLIRGVETAIADGGPEVTQKIGDDLGVPKPQATVKTPAAEADDSESTSDENPAIAAFDMKTVDRSTKAGRLILSIEGNSAVNPRAVKPKKWMQERNRPKLDERREELVKQIATTEKNRARLSNFKTPPPERDGLLKDKAELAMIDGYLDKDKPALFAADPATDAVAEQAAGKTTEQIAEGVNDGSIKVDQATVQTVAEKLRREGLKEIRDLKRLSAKDAGIARAAIIASSPDATIRARMTQEMVNIFDNTENSPSMTRKDELALSDSASDRTYKYKKLNYDMKVRLDGQLKEANENWQKLTEAANKFYFGEDGTDKNFNRETAQAFVASSALSNMMIYLKRPDIPQAVKDTAIGGVNDAVSKTVAALAGEESEGIFSREALLDFMGRRETGDSVDPMDFDLSRVITNNPDPSKATKLYYTDGDGKILDENAGLQELKDLSPDLYAHAVLAGSMNLRKNPRYKNVNPRVFRSSGE
jgi:hypothetical protein